MKNETAVMHAGLANFQPTTPLIYQAPDVSAAPQFLANEKRDFRYPTQARPIGCL